MENKKLKVGICIDGVIRNKFEKFDSVFRKKFIKNEGLVGMNENFEYAGDLDEDTEDEKMRTLVNSLIHLPVTTYDLTNHYEFESEKEFHKFMNEDSVLEIFGNAPAIPKAMDSANRIQYIGEKEKMFSCDLVCPGDGPAISATLFFLTKCGCRLKTIKFLEYNNDLWDSYDILITDSPDLIDACPAGKKAVRIKYEYNEFSGTDWSLNNISELNNLYELQILCGLKTREEIETEKRIASEKKEQLRAEMEAKGILPEGIPDTVITIRKTIGENNIQINND